VVRRESIEERLKELDEIIQELFGAAGSPRPPSVPCARPRQNLPGIATIFLM